MMSYQPSFQKYGSLIIILAAIFSSFNYAQSEELPKKYSPNELIVKMKSNDLAPLKKLNDKFDIGEIEIINDETYKLVADKNEDVGKMVKKYARNQAVESVEPNYVVRAASVPNDPYFNLQWGLHNTGQSVNNTAGKSNIDINAPEAWDISTGSGETKIAVLDTGVNYNHEDLTGKTISGYDFVNSDSDPIDDNGHGSTIASVIGASANNSKGIAGISWNAKIMPIKVLDSAGSGTISDLIEGINYAVSNGAKVINMSLVGDYSSILSDTIKNAHESGVILVSAAGNDTINLDSQPKSPISNDGDANWVVGVGAINQQGEAASFSSYGSKYIDVVAPGTNILSAYLQNTAYVYASGTSISAAFVSGEALLIKDKYNTSSNYVIRQKILNGVSNLSLGGNYGKGNVDSYKALNLAVNIKKVGVMKRDQNDDNFYVYNVSSNLEPQILTGSDLWNIPAGNSSIATAGVDIDGDGRKEVAVMKNENGDYNLYVYNSPVGSTAQLVRAMDLWNIPSGDNTVAIAGVDYNGDGRDELAVMKNEGGDYNVYIYFAPTTTEAAFLIGGDKWNIPAGNNVVAMTGLDIDGDAKDEIAVMKNENGDHNLYVYYSPNGMEPAVLAGIDKWEIPSGDNTIGITGIDINDDGRDELGIMKNENGDHNFYVYQAPTGTGPMPLLAGDKWNIPSGNNVVGIATVE